ncbi:MAG: U32 family peptidase [bacterium]|nr:U32 family peptidase [bacterium]
MQGSKLELLSPAGDLSILEAAVDYGADAVYLAGEEFGMRNAAKNFGEVDLVKGVKYCHDNGAKVYVACNTIPHNDEMKRLPEFLELLAHIGVDAIIASDIGTMGLIKKYAPKQELHISVQSGIVNYETARAFHDMGANRIVVARELSLDEIAEIRAKTPSDLQIEAFVHGAMCVSFSARCLLSQYMTGRDANRGDCAQSCRWSYSLMEANRPGEYYDITETDKGTYILNANDLCMAPYIRQLADSGIYSLKIEGRAKSHYYVAVATNAYRGAVDSYYQNPLAPIPQWVGEELNKISHRDYSTGFYFGNPVGKQNYGSAGYNRDYTVAAVVTGYENGCVVATVKNKFSVGTQLDCLTFKKSPFKINVNQMFNENNEQIESAPHPMMTVKIPFEFEIKKGSLLRIKC